MSVTAMLTGSETLDEIALKQALSLATRLQVPLVGLCALPDPSSALLYTTSPYMIGVGGAAMDSVLAAQNEVVAGARDMFERIAAGVEDARFEHRTDLTERAAADAATLSDAIVFPHPAGKASHPLARAFEHVLMDARLPVYLSGDEVVESGPALIAWDGSPQVARAVRLQERLIRMAGTVVVAQNPDDLKERSDRPSASIDALGDWLKRRGVSVESASFKGDVAEGLCQLAKERKAQMVVAGAYGHSRAGEFLFGGATRGLLRAEEAPALALVH